MGDWKGVTQTAKKNAESTDRLGILINNAARGIMSYQLTDYGVDRHMAVSSTGLTRLYFLSRSCTKLKNLS
jgi:NAD(P)-dependent dehydrogenase (short-subunit alcohol dehydrogenase family)